MLKIGFFLFLSTCLLPLYAQGGGETEASPGQIEVFVSIPPQRYFVEKIGGNLVKVTNLIGENDDPHTFQPRPSQITALGQAAVYFTQGISLEEAFIDDIEKALPQLSIVDTSEGVELLEMEAHDHHDDHDVYDDSEDHEHHDDHATYDAHDDHDDHDDHEVLDDHDDHEHHGNYDPHFWLGPPQVFQSAEVILRELTRLLPGHREELRRNYENFREEVKALDKQIASRLEPHRGEVFFVYHPAFGYFAHAYGLRQRAVETGGKDPSPRQLEHLITEAQEEGVKAVFVQPQFRQTAGEVIAKALGGVVIPANPLIYDWKANLLALAEAFAEER